MQDLFDFIQFIRKKYMLENVYMMIEGLKCGIQAERLQSSIDPIGDFKLLKAVELSNNMENLYETVLIDSPVGQFFFKYLEMKGLNNEAKQGMKDFGAMQNYFSEENPENVRSILQKIWLEDFHCFCEKLNTTTWENMDNLLKLEGDLMSIQVIYNSFEDSDNKKEELRNSLCPSLGHLYPLHFYEIKSSKTLDELKMYLSSFPVYTGLLQNLNDGNGDDTQNEQSLEDVMYKELCEAYSISFDEQSNMTNFYAYVMLKEQEIRNIGWMAEMISRNLDKNDTRWNKFIVPFDISEN